MLLLFCLAACASRPDIAFEPLVTTNGTTDSGLALVKSSLMQNCKETGHFGLYSYFLVPHAPANNQNFIESIKLFMYKSRKMAYQNRKADPRLINNTYVPIWADPPEWVLATDIDNEDQLEIAARWVVQNYDFKCARRMVKKVPGLAMSDQFLVSSLSRLTKIAANDDMMVQRISLDSEEVNIPLIQEYYKKTWHQRSWNRQSISHVARLLSLSLDNDSSADGEMGVPISGFLAGTTDKPVDSEEPVQPQGANQVLSYKNPVILILGNN
jgi:hypothetical protein